MKRIKNSIAVLCRGNSLHYIDEIPLVDEYIIVNRFGDELEDDAVQEGTYEDFFQSALEKWGVSAPDELDDEEKVKFFNYVDKNWSAKSETD